ncbi:glycosyltransferase family 4 protein [bacterium]|nr:glycosyltransferase family 4 protein [Rubripirellula sp.]MDB4331658.1 glycosyltransferase family 4 protein [bacterium]MDB4338574.1 glycosyltransferase family 4 protein [Rubripirellula sp.]
MRVAHVITRMIVGGAQENTLFNCLDLEREHGDQVLLITGPSVGPEGDLLSQGRAGELRVSVVDTLCREINPAKDLLAYWKIKRLIKEFQPDVVHTHSAKAGVLGRSAAWNLSVPAIIHTVHGAPFHQYQGSVTRSIFRLVERWAAKRCHRIISVADAMTSLMVNSHVADESKFVTIYSGMDVKPFLSARDERLAIRSRYGIEDHHLVIGKIARLFRLKGHDDVIAAARNVIRHQPNARFLFVGDGVLRQTLQKRICDLGLDDFFIFTGLVDPSEVPSLIGAMDLLVHASYREGLARALPQALIAGIPVVSYDIDGAREVVLNHKTGVLVQPGNIEALANGILELSSNHKIRQQYGLQGRNLFTEQFDHREMTRKIRDLYEEELEKA